MLPAVGVFLWRPLLVGIVISLTMAPLAIRPALTTAVQRWLQVLVVGLAGGVPMLGAAWFAGTAVSGDTVGVWVTASAAFMAALYVHVRLAFAAQAVVIEDADVRMALLRSWSLTAETFLPLVVLQFLVTPAVLLASWAGYPLLGRSLGEVGAVVTTAIITAAFLQVRARRAGSHLEQSPSLSPA
jgi:hypothetical protein